VYTRISYYRDWIIANSNYSNNRITTTTTSSYRACSTSCLNGANCDIKTGLCTCQSGFIGSSCDISMIFIILILKF
jgi:hypothetical protein